MPRTMWSSTRRWRRTALLALLLGGYLAGFVHSQDAEGWGLRRQNSKVRSSLRGICGVSDEIAWASGTDGICLRTTDGGETWEKLTVPGAAEIDFRDVHAWSAERALVMGIASPARFFLTEDGGQTWTEVYHNDDPGAFFDAIAFWDEKRGVAFGDPIDGKLQIITTSDAGKSWRAADGEKVPAALEGEGGFAGSGTCLAVGEGGLALIGLGGAVPGGKSRVMRSEDYGATWTVMESPLRADAASGIFSICILDKQRIVAVGGNYKEETAREDTAMLSTDGGITWSVLSEGSPLGYRSAVAVVPNAAGKQLIACGPSGTDVSTDGGATWRALSDEGFHAASFGDAASGWVVGSGGRIAKLRRQTQN